MSFSIEEKLPGKYFQEVMDLDNPLILSHYCGNTMATFKFYFCNDENASPIALYFF